jgi:hypothetical protein
MKLVLDSDDAWIACSHFITFPRFEEKHTQNNAITTITLLPQQYIRKIYYCSEKSAGLGIALLVVELYHDWHRLTL